MESRIKILGHPVHPMLIVFPLALFSIGVLFDVIYLVNGDALFADLAFWNIGLGIVGGVAAAIFGLIDWTGLMGTNSRARRIGLIHGLGNGLVLLLFTWSWLLRMNNPQYAPDILPFALGLVGVGLSLVTAWLGGELVYRLRVGVDDDAHIDAGNSLAKDGLVSFGSNEGSYRSNEERSSPVE